jgi:hypothetical protein
MTMTMRTTSWVAVLAVALACLTNAAHARSIRTDMFGGLWTSTGTPCNVAGSCNTANLPASLDDGFGPLALSPGVTGDTYQLDSLTASAVTYGETHGDGTFLSGDLEQADSALEVEWSSSAGVDQEAIVYMLDTSVGGGWEIDYNYGVTTCPNTGTFAIGDMTYTGPVPSDCSSFSEDEPTFFVSADGKVTLPQGWEAATTVPEPSTLALLGMTLPGLAIGFFTRRKGGRGNGTTRAQRP